MIRTIRRSARVLLAVAVACVAAVCGGGWTAADEWPQFRGPDSNGHARAKGLPKEWSESKNIVWKTAILGRGWSSPVVSGDRIWLTTAIQEQPTEEYKAKKLAEAPNPDGLEIAGSVSLRAVCVSLSSGKLLHDVELFYVDAPQPIHSQNSYASPSPVLRDGRLYCHFGTYGTACLDAASGKIVWKNQQLTLDHQNGPGASPILWKNLLIATCDGIDVQYIAALDAGSGKLVWKTSRSGELNESPPLRKAYGTPLVVHEGGREQLISPAADWVYSYDPATGQELWKAKYGKLGFSNAPQPVVVGGRAFICTCFMESSLLSVRLDGSGDVSQSHIEWRYDKQMPRMPTPIAVDGLLYIVNDGGVATCLEASSGDVVWRERIGGNFCASPIYADGCLFFSNREGETTVVRPGETFEKLAVNRLDGAFYATPAVVGRSLILRTDTHLYRIADQETAGD